MILIDGKKIAQRIQAKLTKEVAALSGKGIRPGLAIVMIGDNASSQVYVSLKEKVATDLGFYAEVKKLSANASMAEIEKTINAYNNNKKIHGIIVQLPLPKKLNQPAVLSYIDPAKDIDILNSVTLAMLATNSLTVSPPTAQAVLECIASAKVKIAGANVLVIGAGFFGRQIALHCLNSNATVTIAHDKTKNLTALARQADIIVSAVGKPGIITGAMIKKGAVVIDVGTSVIKGQTVGDVDFTSVSKKAFALSPVPGGVGPVTVACLMSNVVQTARGNKGLTGNAA